MTRCDIIERRGHYVVYWRVREDGTRTLAYSDMPLATKEEIRAYLRAR